MTVTEQARHRLHAHLEEIMGEEHAAALMEWLPDGPLASKDDINRLRDDVKRDFDHLREVMDLRFEAVDRRFEAVDRCFETMATKEMVLELKAQLHHDLRMHTVVLVGTIVSVNGLLLSTARIF